MADFQDLFGFGKVLPIDKLVDIVTKSFGRLSKPYFDKKDIDTKAYEIEKLAEAKAKANKIMAQSINENSKLLGSAEYKDENLLLKSSPKVNDELDVSDSISLELRTQERLNFQDAKKQLNIEAITAYAAEDLKNEDPVTDEPLDEDWITRFFRIAEDISNDEMQAIWGKILAGEVKQPTSYSLRTLEVMKNMSKKEADIFVKVANFTFKNNDSNYLFIGDNYRALDKYEITYSNLLKLMEAGLLQGSPATHSIRSEPEKLLRFFTSGDIAFLYNTKANNPSVSIPVYIFSSAGNELLKLIKTEPNMSYLSEFAQYIKKYDIEVGYSEVVSLINNELSYKTPIKEFE